MGGGESALSMGWGVAALIALYLAFTAISTLIQRFRKTRRNRKEAEK